jgi:hypothetical protein
MRRHSNSLARMGVAAGEGIVHFALQALPSWFRATQSDTLARNLLKLVLDFG